MKFSRKSFFWIAGGVSTLSGLAAVYARFVEPKWFWVNKTEIKFSALSNGQKIKILHLSDFHSSPEVPYSQIETAIRLGISHAPDLVCLTGDFITHEIENFDRYHRLLKLLTDQAPTFACFGNHDRVYLNKDNPGEKYHDSRQVAHLLECSGVFPLFNEKFNLQIKGLSLTMVGVGDYLSNSCRPVEAFQGMDTMHNPYPTILLCHNPDAKQILTPHHWDLMLCGHTHGGQLNLLGARPFLTMAVRDKKLVEGLYSWPDASSSRSIFITRGVGSLMGARFNCRPEVSVLSLVSTG